MIKHKTDHQLAELLMRLRKWKKEFCNRFTWDDRITIIVATSIRYMSKYLVWYSNMYKILVYNIRLMLLDYGILWVMR